MPIDDISLLRLFVAVVDAGSLSAAAREQHITLPSASRKLQQLETALGVRLLQRTTRRQSLTDEGQLLYHRAIQVFADLDQVEQQLLHKGETISGPLKITAPISLGRRRIAPLLADFRALHPKVQIQMDLTDAVLDLVDAGVDFAVRLGGLTDSSYVSRPLAPNHRVLCASPAYLRNHGEPREPADLTSHHCLHIGLQLHADWHIGDVAVRLRPYLSANDGDVVHQWALEGRGIALKSIWDVAEDLQTGKLLRVLSDYQTPAVPLHAIYPHKNQLAPRVRACIDYLAANLRYPREGNSAQSEITAA